MIVIKKGERSSSPSSDTDHGYLPEDLVVKEILSKLPVKSLIRFKCVSKKWHKLITNDSCLVSNHLRHHSKNAKLSIILARRCFDNSYYKYRLHYLVDGESNITKSDVSYVMKREAPSEIIGSCNGLVCVSSTSLRPAATESYCTTMLWNPATREWRDLPMPTSTTELTPSQWTNINTADLGFGFDEHSNDYKLVRIVDDIWNNRILVQVLTTSNDRWREVKSISGYRLQKKIRRVGVLFNGALYWLINKSKRRRFSILSFNLRNEESQIIDVPLLDDLTPDNSGYSFIPGGYRLTKWKESLALLSFKRKYTQNRQELLCDVVLAMTSNAFDKSIWTPLFRISGAFDFCGVWRDQFLIVNMECYRQNLYFVSPLNPKEISCTIIENVLESGWDFLDEAYDYVPSLVSVHPKSK